MKKGLSVILAIVLTFVMTASAIASGINYTPDLLLIDDTDFTFHIDEDKEPDCHPDCDLPIVDDMDDEY